MGLFLRGSLGKDAIEVVGFRVEFEWTLGDELWQEFVFSLDLFWIERPKTTHDFYGDRLGHGLFLSTSNFWNEKNLLRFFDDISFSRMNSNETYRYET